MKALNGVRLKCEGWMHLGSFLFYVLRFGLVVWYFAMNIHVLLCILSYTFFV